MGGSSSAAQPGRGQVTWPGESFLVVVVTTDCLMGGLAGVWVLGADVEGERNKGVEALVGVLLRTWAFREQPW